MRKKKLILIPALLAAFLTTGITVYAAKCPKCEEYKVDTDCIQHGTTLWFQSVNHTVQYSEDGVLKTEICTIGKSEDLIEWECPKGHGIVSSAIRHKEMHSSSHCEDLDYIR